MTEDMRQGKAVESEILDFISVSCGSPSYDLEQALYLVRVLQKTDGK